MSGYTPGPWTVQGMVVVALDAEVVVSLPSLTNSTAEQARANARLIAAAPDLLAALHRAADALADYSDVNDGDDGPTPNTAMSALQEIEAVIARAEGKPR